MKIGLSYDLKKSIIPKAGDTADALEEYDSVETVETIKKSLESAGHQVSMLGGGREFITGITNSSVDIVFNIAEGRGIYRSREAQVPAILEMLEIPYSGSDPLTLTVCLDKPLTKKLVSFEGIATPAWKLFKDENTLSNTKWNDFKFPAIIKPAFEGSSKGIHRKSLVHDLQEARIEIVSQLKDYKQPVMAEEFIDGDEVTVGIIGNNNPKIVGLMRILPRQQTEHFVYSVEVKRDWEKLVEYECPAKINSVTASTIRKYSLKSYEVLGCRDFTRIDFRINAEGKPFFLEINPLPGLGWYSDLIIMAKKMGWSHEGLITSVFDAALERYPQLVCA
jgi:D-alanine-D-alanine ligase